MSVTRPTQKLQFFFARACTRIYTLLCTFCIFFLVFLFFDFLFEKPKKNETNVKSEQKMIPAKTECEHFYCHVYYTGSVRMSVHMGLYVHIQWMTDIHHDASIVANGLRIHFFYFSFVPCFCFNSISIVRFLFNEKKNSYLSFW